MRRYFRPGMRYSRAFILLILVVALILFAVFLFWRWYRGDSDSNDYIRRWLVDPASHDDLRTVSACPDAPFILPSEGLIGLLWGDTAAPYTGLNRHTGVDIFGAGVPGTVPIIAAYDGYLSRLDDWLSSVIIRHEDPLQSGRTIYTYYTHMASRDGRSSYVADTFPPGTYDVFVEQGALLGYQGDYNGTSFPIAMHLHFSIVQAEADGSFKNEAIIGNTLDPSPYFGFVVDSRTAPQRPIRCTN